MKISKLTIIALLGITLFTSCEKEIEFNGEQIDPKLVVNSLLEPGKPISANISQSVFFLDNNPNSLPPDDLVATLYVNGNCIGEMTPHTDTLASYSIWNPNESWMGHIVKVYTHDYCPAEGDIVKITASANGFDDVEGSSSALPNEVNWRQTDLQPHYWDVSYYEYEGDTSWYISATMELYVEVTDPNPGKTDYFKIYVDGGNTYDETGCSFYISTSYSDPVFGGTISENDIIEIVDLPSGPEGVFTDVLFDGKSYTIKLPLYLYITYWGENHPDSFPLLVQLQHLTKEYYYYLNTCDQGDEIMQYFSEPIQTYTNVEGGYGIVGGRTMDTITVTIPLEK